MKNRIDFQMQYSSWVSIPTITHHRVMEQLTSFQILQ